MTPVREGLDLLVSAGLAERVPYRGVRVREMVTKDVVEAYGLRLDPRSGHRPGGGKEHNARTDSQVWNRMLTEMKKHQSLKDVSTRSEN